MSVLAKFLVQPSFYLRAAALLTLLLALGHSIGGLQQWSPTGENETLRAMRAFVMDVAGLRRTYFDFYIGFGWIISVYLLLQTVLLWQASALIHVNPHPARFMAAAFLLANVAAAALSAWYLFAIPAGNYALIAMCIAAAVVFARRPGVRV